MYGEDREWCWRISRAGWAIGVRPKVEFPHGGGISATKTWGGQERCVAKLQGTCGQLGSCTAAPGPAPSPSLSGWR